MRVLAPWRPPPPLGHWMAVAVVVAALLAGCLDGPSGGEDDGDGSFSGTPAHLQALALGPLDPQAFGREPAVAELADGTRFVAAWAGQEGGTEAAVDPRVWRGDSGGTNWTRLTVGALPTDAVGNSDVDLAVDPDGDTLYLAALFFLPVPAGPIFGAGAAIGVGVTHDAGDTWAWTVPVRGPFVDRPWIAVDPDGVVHLVWNDARGVHHATSTDEGESFRTGPLVLPRGGDGGFDIGPNGELAVRIVPPQAHSYLYDAEADGVAISTDGGAKWRFEELPGQRDWQDGYIDPASGDGVPRLWDPIAFDAAGNLYAAWAENGRLVVAYSPSLGSSWGTLASFHADEPGVEPFFPFLVGLADGGVAATYFTRTSEGVLDTHLAVVRPGATPSSTAPWAGSSLATDTGGTWGEYFQLHQRADGTLWSVVPVGTTSGPLLHLYAASPAAAPQRSA